MPNEQKHPSEMHASEVEPCKRCKGSGKLATKTGAKEEVNDKSIPWQNVTMEDQRAALFMPCNCPECGGFGKVAKTEKTKK